jgi:hypothetical protein
MMNNFTEAEIVSKILYHKAASKLWLDLYNRTKDVDAAIEYQNKCVYHCNRLLSWEVLFERVTGHPYRPLPESPDLTLPSL